MKVVAACTAAVMKCSLCATFGSKYLSVGAANSVAAVCPSTLWCCPPSSFVLFQQVSAVFWDTRRNFCTSGQHISARWSTYSEGNTILDYIYILFGSHQMVLQLINPDIGVGGVGGNAASGLQMVTSHTPSGRQKKRLVEPALVVLVQNSADMVAVAKKHADASKLSSLSATLKNLKDACAEPEFISTVEDRLRLVLEMGSAARLAPTVLFPGGGGGGRPASVSLTDLSVQSCRVTLFVLSLRAR